ncbi:uncharacterized transmembrane protein DDB_G0289901-like [Pecten maximus]|uniref:uncharacterized transmembrane protein DDB_G0289901-like n=1 Tax=Pecten maximus TaxID=6579 RepID=UPI00145855E0|nr:uncharacterized transmembrane protein DDB_G0289901-like [Pecten maximus]
MALLPLLFVVCSLSMVLSLHILPCEPGMAGPLGCDSFFSRQSGSPTVAIEPEFRDRGLGDQGFGERFGGINSDQFFDGGNQDQFFDGGAQDQIIVSGQDQFIGGGVQDPFMGGSGGTIVSGGFENGLGVLDNSFGNDQGILLDGSIGISNPRGDMGSFGMKNIGSRGIGMSSRFGKGKSRGVSSSISYPKGFSMSKKGRGSALSPSIGKSGRIGKGMLGIGRQRGYPKFQNNFIGMNRGISRSSLSYPKGGWSKGGMTKGRWNKGGWNKGGWNKGRWGIGGSRRWRGKGTYSPITMDRSYLKGIGKGRMSSMGNWGQRLSYPKGISRPSFTPSKRRSGGY